VDECWPSISGRPWHKGEALLPIFTVMVTISLAEIVATFSEAGLNIVESGAVGISDLQFVLAEVPCHA
jgi:hypothetical protein